MPIVLIGQKSNVLTTLDDNQTIIEQIRNNDNEHLILLGDKHKTGLHIKKLANSGSIIWDRSYHYGLYEKINDLCLDNTNNIYLTGFTQSNNVNKLLFYKLKSNGGLYTRIIYNEQKLKGLSIHKVSEDRFIILAQSARSHAAVLLLNSKGEIQRSINIDGIYGTSQNHIIIKDQCIYVLGSLDRNTLIIYQLSSSLDIIRKEEIPLDSEVEISQIIQSDISGNNHYLIIKTLKNYYLLCIGKNYDIGWIKEINTPSGILMNQYEDKITLLYYDKYKEKCRIDILNDLGDSLTTSHINMPCDSIMNSYINGKYISYCNIEHMTGHITWNSAPLPNIEAVLIEEDVRAEIILTDLYVDDSNMLVLFINNISEAMARDITLNINDKDKLRCEKLYPRQSHSFKIPIEKALMNNNKININIKSGADTDKKYIVFLNKQGKSDEFLMPQAMNLITDDANNYKINIYFKTNISLQDIQDADWRLYSINDQVRISQNIDFESIRDSMIIGFKFKTEDHVKNFIIDILCDYNNKGFYYPVDIDLEAYKNAEIVFHNYTKNNIPYNITDIDWQRSMKSNDADNDFAVIIGIENYKYLPQSVYSVNDASSMKLLAVQLLNIRDENIMYLTDNNATKAQFEKVFGENGWLERQSNESSKVYVYYSGHGYSDYTTGEAYLIPYDADPEYINTSFKLDAVYNKLNSLSSKSSIVLIDACFSGFNREKQMLLANARPFVFESIDENVPEKVNVFTASSSKQIASSYNQKKHGLFTYYLISGITGNADKNNDNSISMLEMHEYISQHVKKESNKLYSREQTTQFKGDQNQILFEYVQD